MKKKLIAAVLAAGLVLTGFQSDFLYGNVTAQAAENAGTVIDVTDFGADPSGKEDSTAAVVAALEEAKETDGKVTVNFPKGEYHFWKDYATKRTYHTSNTSSLSYPEKYIGILLEDVDNVTLEGNGSSLIMHGDMMAIAAVDSSDVTFHDFVLDYKDPDTVDISVVGSGTDDNGKAYTDFYVPANYNYKINEDGKGITWQGEISPVTGAPYWEKQSADFCAYLVIYKGYDQTVARAGDKAASNPFAGVESIVQTGENVLRFTYTGEKPKDQEEGNIFLLSDSATRKTTGAFFWESENVLVDNIDVHYLSGFGWLTQMCKNVEFKGVDFLPRYGTGKYTTSNADQLHVAGCGGYFKVTDCNFSMSHDDPINVHGSYMRVEEVIDNKTLKVQYIHSQQGGFQQFHPGDEVLFYSRTYLEPPAGEVEDKPYIVESSIGPGEEYNGEKLDMRTEIVTFKEEFSEDTLKDLKTKVTRNGSTEQEGLYVAENVTYTPAVTISGNHMKSIPTRGILCTTRQPVIIENNVFDNMAMANIYLSNDADYWYESGPIRNMIIKNNEFYIRSTGQAEWGDVSGIFVDPVTLGNVQDAPAPKGDTPVHRNITIEENTFHMGNDNVVTAQDVDGMKIINNKIIRDDADIQISLAKLPTVGIGERVDIAADVSETTLTKDIFKFTDCENVVISGNTYDDGLNLNVTTAGEMEESDVSIEDGALTLNKQGGNLITSESKLKYVTSDPDTAYVDEQGRLVGVKTGEVTLTAYAEWNGTIVKSEPVAVQVGEGAGSSVSITAEETEITTEGGTAELTYTEGAQIEVVDPVTGEPSNAASVNEKTYTALKEGVVLVRATLDGKSSAVLMVNSFTAGGDDPEKLADGITVDQVNSENLSGSGDEITIKAETGSELFGNKKDVTNLVKFQIPEDYKTDLRVQVDVTGLPIKGDGYNNAGIILYNDGDNYYSVGKKGHMAGVTAVYEENAIASEKAGDSQDNSLAAITFEIEILDNTATVRYLDANGVWKDADKQDISNIMSDDVYLALCAWQNGGSDFSTTFSNIKIAKASETTTEDMSNVPAQQIFAQTGVSYGNPELMTEGVTVDEKNDETLSGAKNEITIKAETGSDLYGGNTHVTNLVKFQIPEDYKTDLRVQVDVKGLPITGNGYNNAGIILYNDGDNYYSVGKKGHMAGVTAVYEENATASERAGDSQDNSLAATTFEIEILDNTATVRYLDANGVWKDADKQDISNIMSDDVYLALCAWQNGGPDFSTTFSNIKIAKASETTTEDMSNVPAQQIFDAFTNERPTVSNVQIADGKAGDEIKVSADTKDEDGIVDRMIYQWTLTDEAGRVTTVYTSEGSYTPAEPGTLQVSVIAIDNYGKPSEAASSEKVEIEVDQSGGNTLNNLYINGNPVEDFDKEGAEFILPEGSNKLRISYDLEDAGVKTVIKDGDGKELATVKEGNNYAVVSFVDELVIVRGDKEYTIAVRTQQEGNVNVRTLSVNEQEIDLADEIRTGTDSYFVKLEDDDAKISLETADENAAVEAVRSFFNIEVPNTAGETTGAFAADVDLTAGINAFYFTVTGADGITEKTVRLYLFRDGHNESALSDLKVNGTTVEGFTADQDEYTVYVDGDAAKVDIEAVQGAAEQTTCIVKDGVRVDGTSAECDLGSGLNQIVVANKSENMWTTSYYTLNIVARSDENADLLQLNTDETMSPAFDPMKPDVTEYKIEMHKGQLHVDAQALMDDAKVRVYTDTEDYTKTGSVSADLKIYEGENTVSIEVTSPDGTEEKTYVLNINARGLDYASDEDVMNLATKTEVGYGTLQLDKSSSGGAIALMNEDGERVEFEKGLGAHASSEIAYNIEGQGYTAFEAYVGVDYYQVAQGDVPSSVRFRVLVDGKEKFNSDVMTVKDAMKKVEVDVTGAKSIQLIIDEVESNAYDHADWADAKFIKPLEDKPEKPAAKQIVSVTNPESIIVRCGTAQEDLPLPKKVEVGLDDGTTAQLGVTWSCDSYNAEMAGSYTFAGTLAMTEGIENPENLIAEATVTVEEKTVESSKILSVDKLENIEAAYGTSVEELGLPDSVTVRLSDGTAAKLGVTWNCDSYNAEKAGNYTFTGTLALAEGIENPDNLTAEIIVTVKEETAEVPGGDDSQKPGSGSEDDGQKPSGDSGATGSDNQKPEAVKTGDAAGRTLWAYVAAAIAAAGALVLVRRKNRS